MAREELPARQRPGQVVSRGLLRRAVWVLARLKAGAPIKATLVAREFEVSVRTAYRDLDFLRDEWRVPGRLDGFASAGGTARRMLKGFLDGGCILRLRVTGLGEVRRWVMQFGSDAEVLAPASLRRQVCKELSAALVAYRARENSKRNGRSGI